MSHTRSCSRRFLDRLFAIKSYIANVVSPFTPIAKMVYEYESVKDFREGFSQVARLPKLLLNPNQLPETRALLKSSWNTNITNYFCIAMMYRRFFNIIYQDAPSSLQPIVLIADYLLIFTFLSRMYVRRFVENTINAISVSKATVNDIKAYTFSKVSNDITLVVSSALSQIYGEVSEKLFKEIKSTLETSFAPVFVQKEISSKTFDAIRIKLQLFFRDVIYQLTHSKFTIGNSSEIADLLAKSIVDEFENAILVKKQDLEKESLAQYRLAKALSAGPITSGFNKIAKNYLAGVAKARADIQPFLPAKYIEPCHCSLTKTTKASCSSSLYFLGATLFFSNFPDLVEKFLGPQSLLKYTFFLLTSILNGHRFNEAKLSEAGLCTRHRYMMVARNKARLLGEGLAYLVSVEAFAYLGYLLTGVDDGFTRDAIISFLTLVFLTPAYVFNEPLPGKEPYPIDVFLPIRKATLWLATGLKEWLLPNLDIKDKREKCIAKVRSILNSYLFHSSVYLILGTSEFIPKYEFQQLIHEKELRKKLYTLHPQLKRKQDVMKWEAEKTRELTVELGDKLFLPLEELSKKIKQIESAREWVDKVAEIKQLRSTQDLLKERDKIQKLKDPLRVLCNNTSFRLFLKLYSEDIQKGMKIAELVSYYAPWCVTPLKLLPLQGAIISIVEVPLHLLNEPYFEEVSRILKEHIMEINFAQKAEPLKEHSRLYQTPTVRENAKLHPTQIAGQVRKPLLLEHKKDMSDSANEKQRTSSSSLVAQRLSSEKDLPLSRPLPQVSTVEETKEVKQRDSMIDSQEPNLKFGKGEVLKVEEPSWSKTSIKSSHSSSSQPLAKNNMSWTDGLYRYGLSGIQKLVTCSPTSKPAGAYELRRWK